ncbi:MAG: 3-phosphoshikimate 1-carboxyvinyltransferase [Cytophagaceae bacterium]|nr:3-phosphoshikimate 1-carboxyvinyltransferase [Cytophagaceae bacterium]
MKLKISKQTPELSGNITITGSKSESNRLLILQAFFKDIAIKNLSNSEDSQMMQKALASRDEVVDIHHAGTAMRFLTAYFAVQDGRKTVLTGSQRMQERPVGILVDALRSMGADIEYKKNEGYPPLLIHGKNLAIAKVKLAANVSSQYISALMMMGGYLPQGIEIELEGKITSVPYIKMTQSLLTKLGMHCTFEGQVIQVGHCSAAPQEFVVESDWSSASYYYSLCAIASECHLKLSSYKKDSLQGDSIMAQHYREMGVETHFADNTITLTKIPGFVPKKVKFNLVDSPDTAQTIAVTCFAMGIGCHLTGLHTLKIKETDRLEALKVELTKMGADIKVTEDSLTIEPSNTCNPDVTIKTYQDHRMAMAFAPLALKVPIAFEDAEVVNKSYPDYWDDMEKLGFEVSKY